MTALLIKTKSVRLKDGTRVVINAADFNPALHSDGSKPPPVVKKQKREAGVMRSGGRG